MELAGLEPATSWLRSRNRPSRSLRIIHLLELNVELSQERVMGLEPTTFCMASRRSSQLSYTRKLRPV